MKNSQKATEVSFRAAHLLKNKKAFSDRAVLKGAMMIIANTVLDKKNGPDVISTLSDVQLGANTMVRRVSADRELDRAAGPGSS